jgi:hypothetical protein
MGLRLKFNLVLLLVLVLGLTVTAYISWGLLQRDARQEVVRTADLMMETALAIRAYTVEQAVPARSAAMRYSLQSVPATLPRRPQADPKECPTTAQGGHQPDQSAQPGHRLETDSSTSQEPIGRDG